MVALLFTNTVDYKWALPPVFMWEEYALSFFISMTKAQYCKCLLFLFLFITGLKHGFVF